MVHDEILRYIDSHKKEILAFLQKLIQTKSITGDESQIAALMTKECEKDGLTVELVDPAENRTNLVARYRGTNGEPKVLMYSHYDTVPPGDLSTWTHPPFSGVIAEGQIWGRGASDNKIATCGLTMAFRFIRNLDIRLGGDILFTHVGDEERGGKYGFKHLMDIGYGNGYDYLFYGHGGSGKAIRIAANGSRRYQVNVRGKAAHTARLEEGVNGVVKAAKLIRHLQKLADKINKREYHLPGTDTIMKSRFSINKCMGFVANNSVPDRCSLIVDRRYTPLETSEETEKEIQNVIDRLKEENPEFDAELTMHPTDWHELSVSPADSEIVKSIQRAAERVVGFKPEPAGGSHSSDHGFWSSKHRKPFASYGIGGIGNHSPNERIDVEDVIRTTKIYALLMLDLLGNE